MDEENDQFCDFEFDPSETESTEDNPSPAWIAYWESVDFDVDY